MKVQRILLALGGNAIKRAKDRGTADEMLANLHTTCDQLAGLVAHGHQLCLTHGNGPQVGQIYLRNQLAAREVPPWSLNLCVAESEGLLGYLFQQQLTNSLLAAGLRDHVVASLVTQIQVDRNDSAFGNPNKPIGHFYTEADAKEKMAREPGCAMKQDSGRGWRVVVPSPKPIRIVEGRAVRALCSQPNTIVVASGGGGIPVIVDESAEGKGMLKGCDAVIDKDHAAVLLATEAQSNLLMLVTDVDYCYADFGKPAQRELRRLRVGEARRLLDEGHFAEGSMRPKVEACVTFVEATGHPAVITSLDKVTESLRDRDSIGTWFEK